jgi:hypothetical protein
MWHLCTSRARSDVGSLGVNSRRPLTKQRFVLRHESCSDQHDVILECSGKVVATWTDAF